MSIIDKLFDPSTPKTSRQQTFFHPLINFGLYIAFVLYIATLLTLNIDLPAEAKLWKEVLQSIVIVCAVLAGYGLLYVAASAFVKPFLDLIWQVGDSILDAIKTPFKSEFPVADQYILNRSWVHVVEAKAYLFDNENEKIKEKYDAKVKLVDAILDRRKDYLVTFTLLLLQTLMPGTVVWMFIQKVHMPLLMIRGMQLHPLQVASWFICLCLAFQAVKPLPRHLYYLYLPNNPIRPPKDDNQYNKW